VSAGYALRVGDDSQAPDLVALQMFERLQVGISAEKSTGHSAFGWRDEIRLLNVLGVSLSINLVDF
jgi:hypothetical protein